jgi:hypothetical protein
MKVSYYCQSLIAIINLVGDFDSLILEIRDKRVIDCPYHVQQDEGNYNRNQSKDNGEPKLQLLVFNKTKIGRPEHRDKDEKHTVEIPCRLRRPIKFRELDRLNPGLQRSDVIRQPSRLVALNTVCIFAIFKNKVELEEKAGNFTPQPIPVGGDEPSVFRASLVGVN